MQRLLVRIAAAALCASALSGCGVLGGNDDPAPAVPAGVNGNATAMLADLNDEIRQAQLMRTNGDLTGATRILSQLMLVAPDDPRIVGEYGKLLVQESHPEDAAQFLRRAVELQPNDWTLYSALGVTYDQLNDSDNAKLAYEHALVLKPGEPAILNNYAMSRMLARDMVTARALLMQAKASGSTDPKIASNLALLDRIAPQAGTPTGVAAAAPVAPHAGVASITPAAGAPTRLTHEPTQIVMQEIPIDPHAGPVGRHVHPAVRAHHGLARLAKPAHGAAVHRVATRTAPKPPAKPTRAVANRIPALRMTADASKP